MESPLSEILLYVTEGVVAHTAATPPDQRQIARRGASPDIANLLSEVRADRPEALQLGGLITLRVGDRGAIWRSHNAQHSEVFGALFSLLASYPGKPMRFVCEIAQ
jgi:hypothetical protein